MLIVTRKPAHAAINRIGIRYVHRIWCLTLRLTLEARSPESQRPRASESQPHLVRQRSLYATASLAVGPSASIPDRGLRRV